MKQNKDRIILFTVFFLLLFSYTAAQEMQQESKGRIIDMGSYSVEAPLGEDWQIEIEKDRGEIRITKEAKQRILGFLPGRTKHLTIIQISRNQVMDPGKWRLAEEDLADDYRNMEESGMITMGVKTGQYELKDVIKGVSQIGDKKLYFMSYKTITAKQPKAVQEAVLYLYFPPDF